MLILLFIIDSNFRSSFGQTKIFRNGFFDHRRKNFFSNLENHRFELSLRDFYILADCIPLDLKNSKQWIGIDLIFQVFIIFDCRGDLNIFNYLGFDIGFLRWTSVRILKFNFQGLSLQLFWKLLRTKILFLSFLTVALQCWESLWRQRYSYVLASSPIKFINYFKCY